jgi:hypothetical protein
MTRKVYLVYHTDQAEPLVTTTVKDFAESVVDKLKYKYRDYYQDRAVWFESMDLIESHQELRKELSKF